MSAKLLDLQRLDPCWLCSPEAPKRFWQAGQWVASAPPWTKLTGDGIGRLRHVRDNEEPPASNYLVSQRPDRTIHCQWLTGKFATATVPWLPPGTTGVRKDQVERATAAQIAQARATCPVCEGHGFEVVEIMILLNRWRSCGAHDENLRVWSDLAQTAGDPRGEAVAMAMARFRRDQVKVLEDAAAFMRGES